jgi:hypothetical protein
VTIETFQSDCQSCANLRDTYDANKLQQPIAVRQALRVLDRRRENVGSQLFSCFPGHKSGECGVRSDTRQRWTGTQG